VCLFPLLACLIIVVTTVSPISCPGLALVFDILLSEKFVSYDAFPVEHVAYVSECSQDIEPTRFEEAAMENQWMLAMSEEVNAMHKNKT
jgi:hypothetical protein